MSTTNPGSDNAHTIEGVFDQACVYCPVLTSQHARTRIHIRMTSTVSAVPVQLAEANLADRVSSNFFGIWLTHVVGRCDASLNRLFSFTEPCIRGCYFSEIGFFSSVRTHQSATPAKGNILPCQHACRTQGLRSQHAWYFSSLIVRPTQSHTYQC